MSFLGKWGRKGNAAPVSPVIRTEGVPAAPGMDRDDLAYTDSQLADKRWDNPPPGHVHAMCEAAINKEFFEGEHFVRRGVNSASNPASESKLYARQVKNRPKIQVPIATRIVRDMISLRTKAVPMVGAEPMTTEEADKRAARVGQSLLKELTHSSEFNWVRQQLAQTVEVTGLGVLAPYFNPSKGERYLVPTEDGMGAMLAVEGEIETDVASIFDMRFDTSNLDLHKAQWAMRGRVMHVDQAREMYQDYDIQPDSTLGYQDFKAHSSAMYSINHTSSLWFENKYVFIRDYYERRSMKHPEGRHLVFAGRRGPSVIIDEPNPFGGDTIPFVYFGAIPVVGSPYPITTLRLLRSLNRVLDHRVSQLLSDANIVGRVRLLLEKNSGISAKSLDASGLQVLEYMPGSSAPSWMPHVQLPPWVLNLIPMLREMMEYIAGSTDVLKGVNPPGSRSAMMLQHMMEQAHSLFFPTFIEIESGFERHGQLYLQAAQIYYSVPRTIKVAGDDIGEDTMEFDNTDLVGTARVRARAGSALPRSRAMRLEQLMGLYSNQLIDKSEMQEWSEHAVLEDIHVDGNLEKKLVRFEHQTIFGTGVALMPQDHDDHELHMRHHNRIRKKPMWFQLPEQVRNVFSQHIEAHKEYMRAMVQDITGDGQMQTGTMQQLMRPQQQQ